MTDLPTARTLVAILLSSVLASCGSAAPATGISQDTAVAAARSGFPAATGALISAKAGPIHDFDPNQQVVPGGRWVWAIVIAGTYPGSCGPAPLPGQTPRLCPSPATRATILVDYLTGAFIEAMTTGGG